MRRILFVIFVLLYSGQFLFAYPNMIIEHYTVDQGLSNNIVNCTFKDRDGFIWFATWYGLCSFDGSKFKTYNNRDGFYSDIPPRRIQNILEDKNSFLWIKTIDHKLYLFDKKQERFHAVYDDMKNYSENTQIIKIQGTKDGDVLLLTKNKNLLYASTDEDGRINITLLHDSRFEVNTYDSKLRNNVFSETAQTINWIGMDYKIISYDKGESLKDKPADFILKKISNGPKPIFTCAYTGSNMLWLGDENGNIFSVNPDNGSVNKYKIPGITGPVRDLLITDSGTAYLSVVGQGIYEYNFGQNRLQKLSLPASGESISSSFTDTYEKIWFMEGEEALIYYDPLNNFHKRFLYPNGKPTIGEFIVQDADEHGMFFLTPNGDMLLFDRETLTMNRINQLKQLVNDQPNQLFFHQFLDKDGILWLASTSLGVYRVSFPKKQFYLYDPAFKHTNPYGHKTQGVRSLLQTQNGDIWVGTREQEVYRLDRNKQLKQVFSKDTYFIGSVYHIMQDSQGNLWFSTKGNGLLKAEPDVVAPYGFRFTRYVYNKDLDTSISSNDVYFTFQDSRNRIWVATLGGGLNLLSEENGEIIFKHKYNGFKQYPPYGLYMEVRNIVEDNDGRIWVGTMDGLMSFCTEFDTPDQISFETYREESSSSNVADNDIYTLFKDASSQIWISVFGGGLNKLISYDKNTHKPEFKSYGLKDGLNSDVVMSIVEDNNENLWFATESGLSYLNKKSGLFRNIDKYDGFLNIRMEDNTALNTQNGELLIGCREGILVFSPDKLETYNADYNTYIVDFKVSNRELQSFRDKPILTGSIKYADEITLDYNQSMFAIEFAALNYYNQNRVTYKYILNGYEREYHYTGKNRIASYTNVPPGKYTFEVQAIDEANPDLHSVRKLAITILPPWWRSWWAYTIYVILGIVFLIFILRLIFFMMKMKNDIYIEQKLSELKIKFFTNISHELRTPLTLIKGPIQELKEREKLSPKGQQYVELMEKNTNQMLQLVNQILDFRKIQNGKMRLHISQVDLNEMMTSFHKEFRILSEENEISFSIHPADEPIFVWADKEQLGTVIRNILSNAFKFTPSGGSIFITTGVTEDGKRCFVRVEDTGIGIPQNKLTEIFERFSQGENAKKAYYQGTGIGLALSKEIINLHHGEITAESKQQQGSTFVIELLLGKEHFKSSEVDFYVSDSDSISRTPSDNSKTTTDISVEENEMDSSLPSLLLVEDNKDLCDLIKLQLEDKFNVYVANNGVEGLKKIHLYHPDIVVTDQMMPEMDGMEMLQCIRKDFQISHIPVIILTAKNNDEAKTKAISMGANAYITKPFSKEYLIARVEQLLKERKLFREKVWNNTEDEDADNYGQYLVKKDVQLLEKIHQVIEENLDNSDFNIDTIAANIGLSRSAFFKKLKSLTGLAPVDLVKEIRLNKSIELIKNSDLSISEIAFAVGFKDSSYYSKCFRKKYNQTPREYMNEYRKS